MITLFIVDDHAIVREGIRALLSTHEGLELAGNAASGREGLEQIVALAPRIAILDIVLPDISGIEVARQIRLRQPSTRVLMLSMHASPHFIFSALQAGAHGYLLKESATDEIIDAIHAVDAGERYLSRKVAGIVAEGISAPEGPPAVHQLSSREREVLTLVANGHSSAEIAQMLQLSPKTVDTYRSRLMQKLNVPQLAGLIKFALLHGLTTLE